MKTEIINGKEYREVTIRDRTKLISFDGDAINPIRRNQKAKWSLNQDGYPCFGGSIPVHLYVAIAWVDGWFEGAEVNHKDFNRINFNANNLEWVTHKENITYSAKNNSERQSIARRGENNGRARFTEEKVKKIRELYDSGMSVADILRLDHPEMISNKQYKSLHSTYLNVCTRKTWKYIA